MNNIYPIDATIVSILFDIRDENQANEAYLKIKDLQERFFDKSLVDFLLSKGVTEERLETFFKAEKPEDYPEIADLYKTEEFFKYTAEKSNEFNKRLYDERLPLIGDENKKALYDYLKELDDSITQNMNSMWGKLQNNNQNSTNTTNVLSDNGGV